ncbi:MAG: hypothetical protein ABR586_05565 [Thermoplasmatota archaeon]
MSTEELSGQRPRARPGRSDDPVKHVHFTGPDRRRVANILEVKARLEGVTVSQLMERYIRDALRRDPLVAALEQAQAPAQTPVGET